MIETNGGAVARYAIGDVQGCADELEDLLARIDFTPSHDELIFVGDLVNRGPRSLEVLRRARALNAPVVLGNHDLHLLTLAEGLARSRPDDTLDEVLAAPDRKELLDWLRRQPVMLRVDDVWVVHAGLLPAWTCERAAALAQEVEAALRGSGYRDFLANLYGSRPDRWDDDLRGYDRLRVIVNAMTRLRFCSNEGVMEFKTKGDAASPPTGFMPWFDVPNRMSRGQPIVCGHWSALGLALRDDVMAIDDGCVWGGRLTALRLEDRLVFQVPCRGGQQVGKD